MTNDEGGTDDEEYRVKAVLDRTNVTMEVWQGATFGCVQCHSHPYDPFDHREFYEAYAFFNNTSDTDKTSDEPTAMLLSPAEQQQKEQLRKIVDGFVQEGDTLSENYRRSFAQFQAIQAARVPVLRELPDSAARKSFVFNRGNWLVHTDEVAPAVPEVVSAFAQLPSDNRLGLAQWLVDRNNPLTARVIVNRFWEQLFGRGIVETIEDFGTQGHAPTHPELLNWLAIEFMEQDEWRVKALLRRIVLSATYRQHSAVTADAQEKDPYNLYLARGPRIRLSAEQIRDQALHVSGLLSEKMYGPSVMPAQPDGVWNTIRHIGNWTTSENGDQHRRGLYTFWRRVSPYPSMIAFDTPSREFCVSRRVRTNTPLQALITLNDPVFIEASAALAQRAFHQSNNDFTKAIATAYELATCHPPDEARLAALTQFFEKTKAEYGTPEAQPIALSEKHLAQSKTEKLSPEMFALHQTANVILNLDEVIMKQ
ncbi:MAG: DUF1553 domain-containing protein [Bacteroidota bacterium]